MHVGGGGPRVLRFAEASERIRQKVVPGLAGQGVGKRRHSPVDIDSDLDWCADCKQPLIDIDPNRLSPGKCKRVFIDVAETDSGNHKPRPTSCHLHRPELALWMRIPPGPQPILAS